MRGRLGRLWGRNCRYEDLAVSIEEHIDQRTEELMEEGLPQQEAARRARREFGNVTLVAERSREEWQWREVEQLFADWRLTLRRLAKAPVFSATVLLMLAIGIGANTAVFSVINRVVLRPLPYPDADRLVVVRLEAPGAAGLTSFSSGLRLSPSMDLTFSEHNRTLASMGVWLPGAANVTGLAEPEEVHTVMISDGVLESLGVAPVAGQWFNEADQDPRGAKSVMLSYAYAVAQRRREIGIRLALGAERGRLRWMFVRSALLLTGTGMLVGLVAAAGLTQLMKSLLYGVSPIDPLTYAAVVGLLSAVSMVASYLPARRAAAVNPVEALRAE